MRRAALSALVSHWRRRPGQLLTLVLGLALATGLWSAVQAVNAEARASYARAAAQLGNDSGQVLTNPAGMITLAQYVALRRAGWQVTPVLQGRARIGGTFVTIMGVDILTYPVLPSPLPGQSDLTPADFLTPPGIALADSYTIEQVNGTASDVRLVETEDIPPGVVLADIATAERILDRPGMISRLILLPDTRPGTVPLGDIAPGLTLSDPPGASDTSRLTESFHLNLTAFGLLSFAVGLFIVHGAAGLAFEQRRAMMRTLRALGVPARDLTVLVMGELAVLAFVSGMIGLVVGYGVAAALLPDVAASLRGLYGAPVSGALTLRPAWVASGLGMALAGAFLAGAGGLWQLSRLPVLEIAGQQRRAGQSARNASRMGWAGLILIGAGGLSVLIFDGLLAGFALLAGLLLGAALLLPGLLRAVLGVLAARAVRPVTQWIWADMQAQLSGLSLALMALLLALATNIGVATMVSSFRLTFTGWLDQRLAAELYVSAASDAQAARMRLWLAERADAVLPIRHAQTRIAGAPVRVYGVADHATYRDNWPVIAASDDMWDRVAAGDAALINEQLARRLRIWPGDRIALRPDWKIDVAGVYSDYGNPQGQVIVSLARLAERFGAVPDRQFGIRIAPALAPALAADLSAAFDLPQGAVTDQASIKSASLSIFEKTFLVTGALNVLTLGVASFAILTSLLTLWSIRLPQLAPVWALGLTRRDLARLELMRSTALAGLTAVLAVPLGLVLAWVLLTVINVEAFGWRLPMFLFPLDWAKTVFLALAAGALAALIPARRLTWVPPATLLRVFADER